MTCMYNPAHPGRILRSDFKARGYNVAAVALHLGVPHAVLSRILKEQAGVSAEQASRKRRKKIALLPKVA